MCEERSWQERSTSRGQSKVLSEEDRLLEAKDVLMTTLGHPGQVLKSEDAQITEVRSIPVILLCGFLGAGKTTLVCKLLEQVNDEILVIVNDIASINIDGAMVRRQDAETIELENGCACCVLGADLSDRLSEIRSRPSLPAAIVIETSGLSDPYGFSQTVRNQSGFELDGVIAVVDAKTLHERTADEFTRDLLVRQLDSAHLVIVTKSSSREEIKLISQLESLTPGRPILFDSRIIGSLQEVVFGSSLKGAHLPVLKQSHDYSQFASESIILSRPLDRKRFRDLLDDVPGCIYRVKGFVALCAQDDQDQHALNFDVQVVGRYWRVNQIVGQPNNTELVVIGRSGSSEFRDFIRALKECQIEINDG